MGCTSLPSGAHLKIIVWPMWVQQILPKAAHGPKARCLGIDPRFALCLKPLDQEIRLCVPMHPKEDQFPCEL